MNTSTHGALTKHNFGPSGRFLTGKAFREGPTPGFRAGAGLKATLHFSEKAWGVLTPQQIAMNLVA